jgi:uncharacterized membrane protein YcaP (DUF421 family)
VKDLLATPSEIGIVVLRSEPRVLVSHGEVNEKNMHEERVTREELDQSLREGGCLRPSECRLAVLEVDGTISVIPGKRP